MDASTTPPGGQIVLIEDDLALLRALAFAFEVDGYSVLAFGGAGPALECDLSEAACLIIDYRLPDENGLDLLDRLRAGGVQAPAILITSQPNLRVCERAAAMGVALVEKPLLSDALLAAVRTVARPPMGGPAPMAG